MNIRVVTINRKIKKKSNILNTGPHYFVKNLMKVILLNLMMITTPTSDPHESGKMTNLGSFMVFFLNKIKKNNALGIKIYLAKL